MNFYLVDDDAVIFLLINRTLLKQTFFPAPLTFERAEDALLHLREHYNKNEQYLIMLDINMPGMNGWDFLRELPAFSYSQNVMVCIYSSSINERDFLIANENPFVFKYLVKPLTLDSLKEIELKVQERFSNNS